MASMLGHAMSPVPLVRAENNHTLPDHRTTMEKARWIGACQSCGWGREFEAKLETEQRNPYPAGELCKICGKNIVWLERVPARAHEQSAGEKK